MMTNEKNMIEHQITGQMTIEEVLSEWEKMRKAAEAALEDARKRKLESAKARALQEAGDIMDRLTGVLPKLDAVLAEKADIVEETTETPPQTPERETPPATNEPEERKIDVLCARRGVYRLEAIENGNVGMHDATWRRAFGGTIYLTSGSHGCINLPLHMAASIYEYVSTGFPVVCYYY